MRRLLTAAALVDEADRHPDGLRVTYVASPAHTNRVREYVTATEWSRLDRFRLAIYLKLPGLDQNLRIFHPTRKGWRPPERFPIVGRSLGKLALNPAAAS